jgi:glycine cleavage system H protein
VIGRKLRFSIVENILPDSAAHRLLRKEWRKQGGIFVKEIKELQLPDDVRYAEDHEWARSEGENTRVGISDYAQDQLGDIVYVELPQVGDTFNKGEEFGTVESVKAVAELYMPVGGEILAVNTALEKSPELVNKSPYGDGWFIQVKPTDSAELDALMTRDVYLETLKGIE